LNILDLIHLECSAFTGENIETIFSLMTKNILKKIDEGSLILNENMVMNNIIDIRNEPPKEEAQAGRCSSC
jgi:hypothetical protein